jgi:alginate O-acetyltransferase complex protein AlgI
LYFFAWPGMEMGAFKQRVPRGAEWTPDDQWRAQGLFRGAATFVLGVASLVALSWFAPHLHRDFLGWAMIFALLATVHFGIGEVLPWLLRQIGFVVKPLFRAPLLSESLEDFWSRRWNLAFVEMDKILFLRPLHQKLGPRGALFGVFVISGILHEMGLSYPANGGWGGPLLYFLLQGALVSFAKTKNRFLTWLIVLLPLPLLFHAPFREALILPLAFWLHDLLHQRSFDWYLHGALWLGCAAHFCIIGASFNVPRQLKWHEDFAVLSRFNRKVFWTYGAFIVGVIISFGLLTGFLHHELFRGERAAVGLSLFIGGLWMARVLTDLFYFDHDDWPHGWQFELGHVMLTFTFVCLSVLFGFVVPLHAWWLSIHAP